jgi:hypothetical protein
MDFMGYSIRTREWRWTEWVAWNQTAMLPIWGQRAGAELYDHREGIGAWHTENENLATDASLSSVVRELSDQLHAHFSPAQRRGEGEEPPRLDGAPPVLAQNAALN